MRVAVDRDDVVFRAVVFLAAGAFFATVVFRAVVFFAAGAFFAAAAVRFAAVGAFFAAVVVRFAAVVVRFAAVAPVRLAVVVVRFAAVVVVRFAAGDAFLVAAVVRLVAAAPVALLAVLVAVVFAAVVFLAVVVLAAGAFFADVRVAGAFFAAVLLPTGVLLVATFVAAAFFATAFFAGTRPAPAPEAFGDALVTVDRRVAVVAARVEPVARPAAAVFFAVARWAAGRVVAFCASAIVVPSLGTCARVPPLGARSSSTRAVPRRLSVLPGPTGVLGVPRVVALPHLLQGVLRVGRRGVRPEHVPRRADVGLGLDPVVSRAPVVVPTTSAVAHGITVHRAPPGRHRFRQIVADVFHSRRADRPPGRNGGTRRPGVRAAAGPRRDGRHDGAAGAVSAETARRSVSALPSPTAHPGGLHISLDENGPSVTGSHLRDRRAGTPLRSGRYDCLRVRPAAPCASLCETFCAARRPCHRQVTHGNAQAARAPDLGDNTVANLDVALKSAMNIDGAIGAALVDYNSGMTLGVAGGTGEIDLTVAAAGNTDVVRAKLRTIEMLNLNDEIEDILITLGSQYHLIRPVTSRTGKGLFLYLMVSKSRANLAMARHQLRVIEESLEL
ncbi:hypothetical protein GA0070558_102324 [Micromonospora haikouensis]|uniref:Roadblock/LAMTOR2 domain-containing protein n=1 Tax=Micromonospora haikouensis TaxID=686309 RepID=A0A1C4U9B8_9ACTN|nr:hypothetical protein GA0070558_102324 [Micromonospora haikouensis]